MSRVPDLDSPQDAGAIRWLRPWLEKLLTWQRTRDPQAVTVGNPLEKFTTRRELTDAGLLPARDTSPTVTRKHVRLIGDGSATVFTVTHGLGTRDVTVHLRNMATGAITAAGTVVAESNTAVTVTFGAAPAVNAYTVIVIG